MLLLLQQKPGNSFKEVGVGMMSKYVEVGTPVPTQRNYMLLHVSHVSLEC